MRSLGLASALLPLILAACATPASRDVAARDAGFRLVADRTQAATGRRSVWLQDAAQARQVAGEIHR